MQTISTKFIPATNNKPKRIKATTSGTAELTIDIDDEHGESIDDSHLRAAQKLKESLDWPGVMYGGYTGTNSMVFVFADIKFII